MRFPFPVSSFFVDQSQAKVDETIICIIITVESRKTRTVHEQHSMTNGVPVDPLFLGFTTNLYFVRVASGYLRLVDLKFAMLSFFVNIVQSAYLLPSILA